MYDMFGDCLCKAILGFLNYNLYQEIYPILGGTFNMSYLINRLRLVGLLEVCLHISEYLLDIIDNSRDIVNFCDKEDSNSNIQNLAIIFYL